MNPPMYMIIVAGNFHCVAFDEMLLEISTVFALMTCCWKLLLLGKCVVFDELLLEIYTALYLAWVCC